MGVAGEGKVRSNFHFYYWVLSGQGCGLSQAVWLHEMSEKFQISNLFQPVGCCWRGSNCYWACTAKLNWELFSILIRDINRARMWISTWVQCSGRKCAGAWTIACGEYLVNFFTRIENSLGINGTPQKHPLTEKSLNWLSRKIPKWYPPWATIFLSIFWRDK